MALREYITELEKNGELHRTSVEIDPALELTEIAMRGLREGKKALLVENPKNAKFPLVINHFSSDRRIRIALGEDPDALGHSLIQFLERMMPPTLNAMLEQKTILKRFTKARPKTISAGVSQEVQSAPDLDALPIQTCWPLDGGRFITYGQVFTYDPNDGKRNIGLYRMHVFDKQTTGMHWQIQKGGGFHYYKYEKAGRDMELAVAMGTSPALLMATIAALPEGIDEAMFAGFLENRRINFSRATSMNIAVPSDAEFVFEGVVPAKERRMEGPFGDHFGHYSNAAEFPVFHIKRMTHRRNAIYPAIIVGKPPTEDKFLGDATQQILGPLIKLIHKEISALWAYYEAGFHNLLVVGIEQRYQKEAMKAALGIMGTDQLSLTKCIVTVSSGVDVRDWFSVLREVRENFDPHFDFVMIPKVPLDTLDFTSYKMNLGSKAIIDATKKMGRAPAAGFTGSVPDLKHEDSRIIDSVLVERTLLVVKVNAEGRSVVEKLVADKRLEGIAIIAAVSDDVDIQNKESYIWGIFTRFDCERDVVFAKTTIIGISPVYQGAMGIDATWKPGYPEPLSLPDDVVKRVDEKWGKIWK